MLRPFGVKIGLLAPLSLLVVVLALGVGSPVFAQGDPGGGDPGGGDPGDGGDNGDNGGVNNGSNNFLFNVVGGVYINADGVLMNTTPAMIREGREAVALRLKGATDRLGEKTELRMVSLAALEAALKEAAEAGKSLPEDVLFMGGLQRIEQVFLYPERNDIVLAGPGEGWVISDNGDVVGETTGLPVLHLEDFLVAMRTSREASSGQGISVSIDPTAEGRQRLDNFLRRQRTFSPKVVEGMRQALGEQTVSLTGVPKDSRFARVLVAADYQMKRLAMDLEEAPIANFPSFLDIMKQKRMRPTNMMPRWWLATNYEPIGKSDDGLAWELRGQGVKCMTEDEFVTANGQVQQTGKANPVAQMWSDNMNERYMELAKAQPVFGDLRNIMDLCVISALIDKEGMLDTVGLAAPMIFAEDSPVHFGGWPVPKAVDTQCSFLKSGREWIITASGGVLIDSWSIAEKTVRDEKVSQTRQQAAEIKQNGFAWN